VRIEGKKMRGLIPVLVEVRKYGAINYLGAIFPTLPKFQGIWKMLKKGFGSVQEVRLWI